uniref:cellulose 1,4-beta-cellobiosidase (non-reducing end) n=3 Tax=Hirondellea gigas TaxID=1518452 RepID=A0A6A7FZ63_9CRUS
MKLTLFIVLGLACVAYGQKVGTQTPEVHLSLSMENCESGSCTTESTKIVLDSNWRWTHVVDDYVNCYEGNTWSPEFCPDSVTCTENCAIDGVDDASWSGTYGVTTTGFELTLQFVTEGPYSTNIGSRVYLLADDNNYRVFYLKNREFIIDVDSSELPCGLNEAGAAYGVGYCDAQCPHDMKFIGGMANCDDWEPSDNDPNSGAGKMGICCFEMDIWEANSMAQSFTPHDCSITGYYPCEGIECGDNPDDRYSGVCDKDGCDWAAYRLNQKEFFGPGLTVDSSQPITLVTQFITSDGTDNGDLVEVRRIYIQNGVTIQNTQVDFDGITPYDSVSDDYCSEIKDFFGDVQAFAEKGGMKALGESLDRGHVLVMSLWDDHYSHMLWLDSNWPLDADPATPGIARGPCPIDSGVPSEVEAEYPDATVKFSNIKIGPIQSY